MSDGKESPFVGPPSDGQVNRDVDRGYAQPRNDAEDEAAKDFVKEAIDTGKDPLDNQRGSGSSKGR